MRDTITLTFALAEEVTPDIFAQRVAEACFNYGALRELDEGVHVPSSETVEGAEEVFAYAEEYVKLLGKPVKVIGAKRIRNKWL